MNDWSVALHELSVMTRVRISCTVSGGDKTRNTVFEILVNMPPYIFQISRILLLQQSTSRDSSEDMKTVTDAEYPNTEWKECSRGYNTVGNKY